ncbi:MAG: J domain-containing protein [Ancalomicrobiaceae bacterium]|nr:J domain-containing protein [Ancalomicrobiaceae bacterium]
MKIDSKLFDRIRVKPDPEQVLRETLPTCEWAGCENAGTHPAPKGRGAEGQYHRFCIDHVRLYNKSYNYFAGMGDDAVAAYQKDSMTGHRPTWIMGVNARSWVRTHFGDEPSPGWAEEASIILRRARRTAPPEPPRRRLKTLELKSLDVLGLTEVATGIEIKSRYKELVKRHHPDANGGDRSNEDLLQEIIRAYNHLRSVGLC